MNAAPWQAREHRPQAEWPNEVLLAFLLSCGAWRPTIRAALPSDEELQAIIAAAHQQPHHEHPQETAP